MSKKLSGSSIKTVVLNGPPGVGKDTIAESMVSKHNNLLHLKVKDALYEETFNFFFGYAGILVDNPLGDKCKDLDIEGFIKLCTDRKTKECSLPCLLGLSPRESLIFVSENIVKPLTSANHYGSIASAKATEGLQDHEAVVFSDGGFEEEVESIARNTPTLLVRLHREGFTFKGDSRSYLYGVEGVVKELDIYLEEGKVDLATDEILSNLK